MTGSKENMDKLPEVCYSVNDVTGQIIVLKRGVEGYFPTDIVTSSREESEIIVNEKNGILEVTMAQRNAMQFGSMFGFHVPGADPDMYDENGILKMMED